MQELHKTTQKDPKFPFHVYNEPRTEQKMTKDRKKKEWTTIDSNLQWERCCWCKKWAGKFYPRHHLRQLHTLWTSTHSSQRRRLLSRPQTIQLSLYVSKLSTQHRSNRKFYATWSSSQHALRLPRLTAGNTANLQN